MKLLKSFIVCLFLAAAVSSCKKETMQPEIIPDNATKPAEAIGVASAVMNLFEEMCYEASYNATGEQYSSANMVGNKIQYLATEYSDVERVTITVTSDVVNISFDGQVWHLAPNGDITDINGDPWEY